MRTRFTSVLASMVAVIALSLTGVGPAHAQVVKIDACPFTITAPGNYLLVSDLVCPVGNAIRFTPAASGSELNLGNHVIDGNGNTTGNGISLQASDVHITNGTLTRFGAFLPAMDRSGITVGGGGNRLNNLVVTENAIGISVFSISGHNTFENIDALNNAGRGFFLLSSPQNVLKSITASGSDIGVEFRGSGLNVSNKLLSSDISGNTTGVRVAGAGNVIQSSSIRGNSGDGIQVFAGATHIQANVLRNNNRGIVLPLMASFNVIESNTSRGNTVLDMEDDNPNCGTNVWEHNNFITANQPQCID